MRRPLLVLLLVLALPASAAAQEQPVVYSSFPLQGPQAKTSRDMVRAIRLALEKAGSPVRYVSLDDSSRRVGNWLPELVARNARRAVQDPATVAYIGEFNSGASAISMPIVNEAEILQVSPSNTFVGLTVDAPGADRGEPDKYRPTGAPTFGRVIPNDTVQGAAAGVAMRDAGVKRVLVIDDGDIYGRGMAKLAAQAARARGITVAGRGLLARGGRNARTLAARARRLGADGVYFGGVGQKPAVGLWRALARVRGLRLFGPDALALDRFTRAIPRAAARRTQLTLLPMAPDAYPAAGQEVMATLGTGTDGYALYAYEAMSVVLDALARGGPSQKGVRDAFFATRDRDSVLGRYSIDAAGDTSLGTYGIYGVRGGRLVWRHAVDTAAP
jgi:branched-chain amino acid transport system substrate-binding protein